MLASTWRKVTHACENIRYQSNRGNLWKSAREIFIKLETGGGDGLVSNAFAVQVCIPEFRILEPT